MKIGTRLAFGFSIMLVLILILIGFGLNSQRRIETNLTNIVMNQNVRIELTHNLVNNVMEVSIQIRTILLDNSRDSLERKKLVIENIRKEFNESFEKYREMVIGEPLLENHITTIQDLMAESRSHNNTVIRMAGEDKYDEAMVVLTNQVRPKVREWVNSMQKLNDIEREISLTRYNEATDSYNVMRRLMLILGIFAIILAASIAVAITRSILKPLQIVTKLVISRDIGMDTQGYERGSGEFGFMIQSFIKEISKQLQQEKELIELVEEVKATINVLATSSSQILAATTQVASGTAETATAINETSTTVEEVQQASKQSAQKAKNVVDSAQKVVQVFEDGKKSVEETISGMNKIRTQMDSIAQTIVRLSEQSQSIGGIIASVTDIADQSNLLAVNAAIEAAKAGEQGKGFAVVAQEIKNMAEQSKQATLQVRDILNDIQKATSAAVMATEQGTKAVEAGEQQSMQAGEAIRILAQSSNEAVQAATQIVASIQQQVIGMEQISVAMQNINQAGTETAASMVQTEKSAKSLHELGQKLKDLVEQKG